MTGNIFNGILAKEQRIDFYLTVGFFLLALQTFIIFYCFVWFHFPVWMKHQLRWISDTCEQVTIRLCQSPAIVNGVVAMTENITTHPENIEAVSKTMQTVISSDVFMASMRRIMKHVLLDRDVQRIVGVSISGISKEAMKNTFSWNPNEAEEARRALIDSTDEYFSGDERDDTFHSPRNPVGTFLRNVFKRREHRELPERRECDATNGCHTADASGQQCTGGTNADETGGGALRWDCSRRNQTPTRIPSSKSLDSLSDDLSGIRPPAGIVYDPVAVRCATPQRRRLMRPQRCHGQQVETGDVEPSLNSRVQQLTGKASIKEEVRFEEKTAREDSFEEGID
jgi:hypothetical protein